jgi:hypothetical protein
MRMRRQPGITARHGRNQKNKNKGLHHRGHGGHGEKHLSRGKKQNKGALLEFCHLHCRDRVPVAEKSEATERSYIEPYASQNFNNLRVSGAARHGRNQKNKNKGLHHRGHGGHGEKHLSRGKKQNKGALLEFCRLHCQDRVPVAEKSEATERSYIATCLPKFQEPASEWHSAAWPQPKKQKQRPSPQRTRRARRARRKAFKQG